MMMSVLWYFAAGLAFCTKNPAWAFAFISTEEDYYAVQESNVTISCKFIQDIHDVHDISNKIIIRWYFKSPEEKQTEILMYHGGQLDIDPNYSRVHFTTPEPGHGDASIEISDLRMSDEGIYQCSVWCKHKGNSGGVTLIQHMNLKVMEKLSAPVCAMEGDPVWGNDVTFQCESSQGTPPLNYSWEKMSENQMLAPNASGDAIGGNLTLKRLSEDNCGSYRCTVENLLETQLCEILLPCLNDPVVARRNKIKVITAVAMSIVILLVVIVVGFWSLRRINQEQVSN
ncbi:coxsackievirus and adenovirus receptor homolog [Entelurus aequoreus]|uniref:coxsackievirus and adenovirus receptor homolog n=1 Tax=Entelurus aequoreus TaxID=161455 RepID=UPI002B1E1D9B|nr:coxsackievirus and adenovirus receptor homolog [Entelurus aequoreus]XP_061881760.1 coxsackievirus and adenovirus receptor homolog [Entelurus aequoreus]